MSVIHIHEGQSQAHVIAVLVTWSCINLLTFICKGSEEMYTKDTEHLQT